MNTSLYNNLLLSNMDLQADNPLTRRVVLLNILLLVTGSILGFFSFYNFFISHDSSFGYLDIIAFLGVVFSFFHVRKTGDIRIAVIVATLNIFIFMSLLVYVMQGKNFTLIWTVFLPVFAMFINGSRRGLIISMLFYSIIFTMAYSGIGIWMDGMWNSESFTRLVAASLGLTFVTYLFENSLEAAYTELAKKHNLEKKHLETLELYSITDPLTGLFNRRNLDAEFKQKFSKAKKHKSYFALFILDIDKFKEYNDNYGHLEGDKALQSVSRVLKSMTRRDSEAIFRVGGEEFCGLLMSNKIDKIALHIETIRANIQALQIEHTSADYNVLTVSIGVCIIESYEVDSLDKMYKIADDNLYVAKESCRNCVRGEQVIAKL